MELLKTIIALAVFALLACFCVYNIWNKQKTKRMEKEAVRKNSFKRAREMNPDMEYGEENGDTPS